METKTKAITIIHTFVTAQGGKVVTTWHDTKREAENAAGISASRYDTVIVRKSSGVLGSFKVARYTN